MTVQISLKPLAYLVALADSGHFGQAAERCFVSQPTLSAQLKKLEEQLGVLLVDRSGKRARLTPVGKLVAARARRMLWEAEQIEELARSLGDPLAGEIRVGLIPTLAPYLLPHVAPWLRERFPKLRIVASERQTRPMLAALDDGDLDLALLALPVPGDGLVRRPLFVEPFVAAVPADHVLAGRDTVSTGDLQAYPPMLLEEGHCLRDQALAVCELSGSSAPGAQDFRATSLETLSQMVAAGEGLTLLPALATVEPRTRIPGVVIRPLEADTARRTIAAVWRRHAAREETLELVAEALGERAASLPGVSSA
jgi:LysR family hydrogen peroxide-inducible transcriptional activator